VTVTTSPTASALEIAAFDFDGTLTTRDCFVPFLVATSGRARLARAIATVTTELLGERHAPTRDVVKAGLARGMLRGLTKDELIAIGIEFGSNVIRHSLRNSTLGRLDWHRRQGHRVVIVSASLRFYLEPVAEALGVDVVLCTELEFDERGIATGELVGANCRGQEKVNRLLACGLGDPARLWAYGDSAGDAELLAMADEATWVKRGRLGPPRGRDLRRA
jgi:phosphatidylglycerophosphatase C